MNQLVPRPHDPFRSLSWLLPPATRRAVRFVEFFTANSDIKSCSQRGSRAHGEGPTRGCCRCLFFIGFG